MEAAGEPVVTGMPSAVALPSRTLADVAAASAGASTLQDLESAAMAILTF